MGALRALTNVSDARYRNILIGLWAEGKNGCTTSRILNLNIVQRHTAGSNTSPMAG
ncbi:hypothetical protein HC028_01130 [Planosporangium flavigriseum]|uniref:hypothetical protein n=1 Tax=Planosporangium flavigriseum TaxID=373681 RepID=UPI00143C77B2|nr:hypothetical protein [Planosporangium flavigriseum]NJC63122.1 hypothetical protein [Planosporangium flavigriseum]